MTHATPRPTRSTSLAGIAALCLVLAGAFPALAQYNASTAQSSQSTYNYNTSTGTGTSSSNANASTWNNIGTNTGTRQLGQTSTSNKGLTTASGTSASGKSSSKVRMSGSSKGGDGKSTTGGSTTGGVGPGTGASGAGSGLSAGSSGTSSNKADAFTTMPGAGLAMGDTVILQFSPLDCFVQPGAAFDATVRFSNDTMRDVDSLAFTIAYDPLRLTYLGVAPESEENAAALAYADRFTIAADTVKGRLVCAAPKIGPLSRGKTDVLPLRFRACDQMGRTALRFVTPRGKHLAAWSKEENVLGGQGCDGVVAATVNITDDDALFGKSQKAAAVIDLATAMPDEMPREDPALKQWVVGKLAVRADAPVALRLQGPQKSIVRTGDDFWVDVVLENDTLAAIDSLAFRLKFDPKVLEVVDEDSDNWIQQNVNAWDGAFHDSYPFDLHYANLANNERGTLDYRVGRRETAYAFPTGIFTRIHFNALRPSDATAIALVRDSKALQPGTWVRGMGIDRLKTTWNDAKPPLAAIRVLPATAASGTLAAAAPK